MKIITALTKAGSPVTGADVNVVIERSGAGKDYLLLYDDGKHGDGVALDGVYANYYTNTGVSGSYTITVHASGTASPEEFTREVKKSVYVSGLSAGEISVTPTSWDTGIVRLGGDAISAFSVSSTSTKDETVMISATDLTDGYGNVIGSENVIGMPSTFVVPAGGSGVFYERIHVPETAKTSNYTGSIVLTSTANSVNIPVTLQADADLLNITFLPPITTPDHFNLTNGRTLPIKFTARDNDTGEFIHDDTVNVTITNSTDHLIVFFTNGTGTDSVRINSTEEQYIVNFHTKNYDLNVGETYTIHVTFGEADALRGYAMANFTLVDRKH
ncbi:MAG: choice-of-anchor X domain-containing protein [Euryarchaeota archaeon]|nr:choice-of-anchor X domain-containing protein [Euryarchaeota archaeon]